METRGWIKDHDYKEGLLGWLYSHFGGLPWMQVVFYGVGAAIIGLLLKLI